MLREQIREDLSVKDKGEIITVVNYQFLESKILSGEDLFGLFSQYDYIVYDEVHYIFSDSQFNRNTDLLIEPIKNGLRDKIFIFLTATPQALLDYQPHFDFKYTMESDYSYIRKIYTYTSENIAESILQNIPQNEKAIYFSSNAKTALELSQKFSNASFYCSTSNRLAEFSNKKILSQIATNSCFQDRFLFTTKVLDNGINIKDPAVRHILIDMSDLISFLQCLGRKRVLNEDDTICLYIKNYHNGNLKYMLRGLEDKLRFVREFQKTPEMEFKKKYRKVRFDEVIDNDFRINLAKYQNYKTQSRLLKQMLWGFPGKRSFISFICNALNYNIDDVENGNEVFEKTSIQDLLKRYTKTKMFSGERENFKRSFFNSIFSPKKTNYRRRGLRSINAILQEDNLPFLLSSRKETKKGKYRNKYYWVVSSTEGYIPSNDVGEN